MDLSLNETQLMLRRSSRAFFKNEFPKSLLQELEEQEKGHSEKLWQKIADLGWLGLPFPEEYGGSGGSIFDLGILMEEIGRACFMSPFFVTVILGGYTVMLAGNEEQKMKFLPKIAKGQMFVSLAITEFAGSYEASAIQVTATPTSDGYVINGTKLFVDNADIADYLFCVVRTSKQTDNETGVSILVVPSNSPGINYTLLKTVGLDRQFEVAFNEVKVPKYMALGALNNAWPILEKVLDIGRAMLSCERLGACKIVLEMVAKYGQQRIQFGRPLTYHQSYRLQIADMTMLIEGAEVATYYAIWKLSEGGKASKEIAIANVFSSRASQDVTLTAHNLMGGIAFAMVHELRYYTRQATALSMKLGSYHNEILKVAQEAGI